MTIRDLLEVFEGKTKIYVQMKTVNPFNKSDVIYNLLYCGEIRGVDRTSLANYMKSPIMKANLYISIEGDPVIGVLMEGSVL